VNLERLEFAKMSKDWTKYDWETVVFNDDTRINCLCSDEISWCWICDKKNLATCIVKYILKHGGDLVRLWNYLIAMEVGSLYKIEQTLNALHYLELLEEELFNTLVNL
jgi:hypothetical protein